MRQTHVSNAVLRLVSAGAIATMLGGVASAADTVTYANTGSDSNQTTTITNTNTNTVNNDNDVMIVNINSQEAKTGNVEVKDNTTVEGAVGSGNASNDNTTATAVEINNAAAGGAGGGAGGGSGGGTGGGGLGGGNPTGGLGGGSALGASTTGGLGGGLGGAVLPEVGASVPMDLSALRSLYTNGNGLAAGSKGQDFGYLIPMFLLSALAGIGTVIRQKRLQLAIA